GAMAAILGLDADAVAALCAEAAEADVLVPANLNGGGQVVVAGHARAVDRLLPLAAARGARAQLLAVSAPFHCPLMEPAAAGRARGIGRAVALRLAAGGATVVVNYRENAPAAEETVRLIAAADGRACAARFDVGDAEAVRVGVQNVVDEHGRLDLLVNNAGLA